MNKLQIAAEQARLEAIFNAARAANDRDGAVIASAKLSAFITQYNPPKTNGFASRAGQRQANERRTTRRSK